MVHLNFYEENERREWSYFMIIYDNQQNKIAQKITMADVGEGLSFFSQESDLLQVGSWHYPQGKKLLAHIHNNAERVVPRTQEFIFVVQGRLKARLYDEAGVLVQEVEVGLHEGLIMVCGGHGYDILEDDTKVIEVKNGPYVGAQTDRRRIESA